jgi:hypothetical protein
MCDLSSLPFTNPNTFLKMDSCLQNKELAYFYESQDLFNITNDLFVRNDIAATILQREDIENKHETMDITGPIQHHQ